MEYLLDLTDRAKQPGQRKKVNAIGTTAQFKMQRCIHESKMQLQGLTNSVKPNYSRSREFTTTLNQLINERLRLNVLYFIYVVFGFKGHVNHFFV